MNPSPQPAAPEPAPAAVPEEGGQRRGAALLRAVEVMEALRASDGDAWTHQQTHASLARYLLEETHEVLEVIDDPDSHGPGALADELGDLLFQILFHARVGQEQEPAWDVDDVARAFVAKMERRNPHVFGAAREEALEDPDDVDQIIAQWHAVKAAERAAHGGRRKGWFDGIPAQLPALQSAAKVVHRARSEGRLDELLEAADAVSAAPDAADWAAPTPVRCWTWWSSPSPGTTIPRAPCVRCWPAPAATSRRAPTASRIPRRSPRSPILGAPPRLSGGRSAPTGRDGTSPEGRNSPWQP